MDLGDEALLVLLDRAVADWELDILFADRPLGEAAAYLRRELDTPDGVPVCIAGRDLVAMGRDEAVSVTTGRFKAAARRRIAGHLDRVSPGWREARAGDGPERHSL